MRLFKRKREADPEPRRCPVCREFLLDEARTCQMCGHPVSPAEVGDQRAVVGADVRAPRAS